MGGVNGTTCSQNFTLRTHVLFKTFSPFYFVYEQLFPLVGFHSDRMFHYFRARVLFPLANSFQLTLNYLHALISFKEKSRFISFAFPFRSLKTTFSRKVFFNVNSRKNIFPLHLFLSYFLHSFSLGNTYLPTQLFLV